MIVVKGLLILLRKVLIRLLGIAMMNLLSIMRWSGRIVVWRSLLRRKLGVVDDMLAANWKISWMALWIKQKMRHLMSSTCLIIIYALRVACRKCTANIIVNIRISLLLLWLFLKRSLICWLLSRLLLLLLWLLLRRLSLRLRLWLLGLQVIGLFFHSKI